MRKGLVIGIVILVLALIVGGLMAVKWYQEKRLKEMMEVLEVYEEESRGNPAEDIAAAEAFYSSMEVMFKKIDSLTPARMMKIDNGSEAYKKYLISASRNTAYNFRFFPYEIIERRGKGNWSDTVSQYATWPWSLCCYAGWTGFPRTDSTGLKSYDMSSYYYELEGAAEELPDPDSIQYLHILVNYDDRDLKLYDEEELMSDEMVQAVFEGAVIVYDLKAQMVVKFYPLEFAGSENVQFTYTGENQYTYEAQESFRQAYAADLEANFRTAVESMISDSLGLPATRIDINE